MNEKKFERQDSVAVYVDYGFSNKPKNVQVYNLRQKEVTFSFEYIVNRSFTIKSETDIPQNMFDGLVMFALEYLLANNYLPVDEAPKYFSDLATLPKYNN